MTQSPEAQPPYGVLTTQHVRRAVGGDQESIAWLVERLTPFVRTQAAFRIGRELASRVLLDDVVSSTWLAVLPKLGALNPRDGRLTPVLLCYLGKAARGIANNLLRDFLRHAPASGLQASSSTTESPALAASIPATLRTAVQEAGRNEAYQRVLACLDRLDPPSRAVIILRGIEGMTNQEAADELDERPNTISQRYRRAIAQLRAWLPESVFDEFEDS